MTNEVKVLSDDALREIETRREARDVVWYHIPLTPTERDALCATVRVLRVQVAQCEQVFELESAVRLPEVGNLNVLQIVRKMAELHESNTALREQLAEARTWIDRKNAAIETWQQQAKELESQLAQLTAERDRYANALESATKGIKCDD